LHEKGKDPRRAIVNIPTLDVTIKKKTGVPTTTPDTAPEADLEKEQK